MRIRVIRNLLENPAEILTVEKLPPCDFHLVHSGEHIDASVAGITIFDTSAFMCPRCFDLYGIGLGHAKGQILVVRE